MIKKLKKRIIILATVSMAVLMTALVSFMNIINYSAVIRDTDSVLDVISQPDMPFFNDKKPTDKPDMVIKDFIPRDMSPEVPYESRFFSATVNADGEIVETDFKRIVSVDEEQVEEYISKAVSRNSERGFVEHFRFLKTEDGENQKIVFLDCGRKFDTFFTFMWISIAAGILGCLIVLLVFLMAAGRIIKPIAESYEKQKRFITDASHEIKTPLTIINANADLLELDYGENESLVEITNQTKRLTNLTKELVYLSKMEESGESIPKIDFPVSDLISETAQQFKAIATSQNKNYTVDVQPSITMNGSPDEIRKLTSILLDNAMKYSDENGYVRLKLSTQKKMLILTVENSVANKIEKENIENVFDRFFRMDDSRNSQTGGHGIGLSVAKVIVESADGKIGVSTDDGFNFRISASIPM